MGFAQLSALSFWAGSAQLSSYAAACPVQGGFTDCLRQPEAELPTEGEVPPSLCNHCAYSHRAGSSDEAAAHRGMDSPYPLHSIINQFKTILQQHFWAPQTKI